MSSDLPGGGAVHEAVAAVLATVEAGQTVWCRTADGGWWKTTAAGPGRLSEGRQRWAAIPVLGWDRERPEHPVNWAATDVRTTDPALADEIDPQEVARGSA